MNVEDYHDFFVAGAGVAGALIGLLFVAISVSQDRLEAHDDGPVHRARASGALTAFLNALTISLFGLIPNERLGAIAIWVAVVGLSSVAALLLSLLRARAIRWRSLVDVTFIGGMAAVFVVQLLTGMRLRGAPDNGHDVGSGVETLAILTVVCFLLGIARSWELIGGPSIGFGSQLRGLGRDVAARRHDDSNQD